MPPATPEADSRRAAQLLVLATILRLLAAAALPLGVDESYAAVVARAPSLSYFDHPPAAFWLAHVAALIGGESPIALRWPFVALFTVTSWLLFRLTVRLFGTRAALWTLVAAQVIPVFSLSSGSWVLPDGPLMCASVAAALLLARVAAVPDVNASRAYGTAWGTWLAIGLCLGAAGLSKYHAVLLALGIVVFLGTDEMSRRWLASPAPWLAAIVAAACVTPVFLWNAEHDWASFRFQAGRAGGGGNPVASLLQQLAGQAGYLLPWFWVPLVVLLVKALRAGPRDRARWFCVCTGAPPVFVFSLAALGGTPGLPHWPAPGFLLLLPLLGDAMSRWEQRAPVRMPRRVRLAAGVFVTLVTIVVTHAATGWVAALVPSLHRRDPAFELVEYRSLRDALAGDMRAASPAFVAATDWIRGAKIGYAMGPALPTLVLNADARHFAFTPWRAQVAGRDGLLLMTMGRDETVAQVTARGDTLAAQFDSLRFRRVVPVLRGQDTVALLGLFAAHGLHAATRGQ